MANTPGRNDPCPCGSGKKYKHCCLAGADRQAAAQSPSHEGAVARVLSWLTQRHKKAIKVAMNQCLLRLVDGRAFLDLGSLDDAILQGIHLNLTEWLLAEGSLQIHGTEQQTLGYALGPSGPLLSVDQRAWLQQLTERPLRLYVVTEVVPGAQMTLCDALDMQAPPVIVREHAGSQADLVGVQLGARIMTVDDHFELSGALYVFSPLTGNMVITQLREAGNPDRGSSKNQVSPVSIVIMRAWLAQYLDPPPMPEFVDARSGEPILLITDHYRVNDWDTLARALKDCPDVEGDRQSSWSRFIEGADGHRQPMVAINTGKGADALELFYRTQGDADDGRPWFEALAGQAARFMTREITDPKGALSHSTRPTKAVKPPDLPPEALAQMIEQVIRRSYARWADEPIPALELQTPREAIQTPAGLERVKGLIRSYEAGEMRQAAEQNRPLISYQFLWDALGISR
ncbi:MAG: SEC-C metal-binding domain-containing protein [Acidiferrobacterales bacterium]